MAAETDQTDPSRDHRPVPGSPGRKPRIVIVGGGHVGLTVALRLQKRLEPGEARITVIDPQSHMTYQPFLPEAAAGSVEPRHVVVPLRQALRRSEVLTAQVTCIDHRSRELTATLADGTEEHLTYDVLVVVPGSVSRALPIPGLSERGVGFKTIGEAIYLRNHVLSRLDIAASTSDPELRRRLLTFLFIGGGYAGIEAIAELESMAREAIRAYRTLEPGDMRWIMVEATGRIMPEVSAPMGEYTRRRLEERRIEVKTDTTAKTLTDGHVVLSDGDEFDADTIAWTAGVKPHPMLEDSDLPRDGKGRVECTAKLQVRGTQDVFAAGDCAAVPDLTSDKADALCGPSAQHAVRQARVLADNVVALLRGHEQQEYRHRYAGSVAGLGLFQGAAEVYGIKLKGLPAWLLHRAYHLAKLPTLRLKARILGDWLLEIPLRRQTVALGELHDPRSAFVKAANTRGLPTEHGRAG
ncbi:MULTISPECIES: NAD(P)/FAD-dependent oxidoreductase [Saccharopolyspora]|uniref:NAD(P)/FAD-dependent oxidoreductase n=1 Tax=Saccharopolyspora gregorii TaxID=33914 RepID=A0ABP6S2N8_9PSEU|nr:MULTISPECIES: FAD-dependent oxidoreductase [unclassified Saccharopolyspora]MCA1188665.1 FAD-dependent oxidoreductase [Saccharopolyspora sp. 6T]MCA1194398.1 FAD-dependent oxidoreductase [Saccharopolyspora sp. 6V]MCA1228779.1 FAD-dependent oxidoreductase [Saccharopolyspora sp. 6M]